MTGDSRASAPGDRERDGAQAPAGEAPRVAPLTRLLPLACLAAAVCLFAAEQMTTFEYTPPGAEALLEQTGSDRHGNALALIAAFAFFAVIIAVFTASRPAATAAAAAGGLALLVFLIVDVPDVNAVGTLDDPRQSYFSAEAVPREGFWLSLVSTLALTVTGIALATLTSGQLAALRPGRGKQAPASEPPSDPSPASDPAPAQKRSAHADAKPHDAGERKSGLGRVRRPRPRQRG